MKKASKKREDEDLNVSWLIETIEANINESKKLSKSKLVQQSPQPFPRPIQRNIINNYRKVMNYLLLFSKSSEANQLIKNKNRNVINDERREDKQYFDWLKEQFNLQNQSIEKCNIYLESIILFLYQLYCYNHHTEKATLYIYYFLTYPINLVLNSY